MQNFVQNILGVKTQKHETQTNYVGDYLRVGLQEYNNENSWGDKSYPTIVRFLKNPSPEYY